MGECPGVLEAGVSPLGSVGAVRSGAELVSALPAEVHVLLLDDLLLLLQRQDERLLLKSHSRTLTATPDGKTMLRPVLRLTSAMTRDVATGEAPVHVCPEQGGGLGSEECGEAKGRLGGRGGPGEPSTETQNMGSAKH